jgi:hypothetical protein
MRDFNARNGQHIDHHGLNNMSEYQTHGLKWQKTFADKKHGDVAPTSRVYCRMKCD